MNGDPVLAALMRRLAPPPPVERIVCTEMLATIANHLDLAGRRVVRLACGHRKVTAASRRAQCLECHAMVMGGEDYDAFRRGRP